MDKQYVIGLLKPATSKASTSAPERQRLMPANVSYTEVELGIQILNANDISRALTRIEEGATELAARDVDVISMGGTPPVVFGGYGFDRKIIERIGRVTSIPATTSQTSAITGLDLLGAKKIILVEPWKDYVHQLLIKFLEASGFQIVSSKTAGQDLREFSKMPSSLSYDLALEGWKEAPNADAVYIPCSAWPVLENIDPIEKETGLPVVANIQTTIWGALRLINMRFPIDGYGRLLREY